MEVVGVVLPANGAAYEMVRLRSVNQDIDVQIGELRARQILNAETIGNLSHVAVWEADPGAPLVPLVPAEPEPDPEPVPDPEPDPEAPVDGAEGVV